MDGKRSPVLFPLSYVLAHYLYAWDPNLSTFFFTLRVICWFYLLFYVMVKSEIKCTGFSAIPYSCTGAQCSHWHVCSPIFLGKEKR